MGIRGRLIQPLLGRRRAQWFFESCLELALQGMNLDAPSDCSANGERAFVERLASRPEAVSGPWTVFDVGANVGDWSATASDVLSRKGIDHVIWAFEPGREPFERLAQRASSLPAVRPQHTALGSEEGTAALRYDKPGSGLASLHERRRVPLDQVEEVEITTLDLFRDRHGIGTIHLLKIDVEGHELEVLRGATASLAAGMLDAVQFEFGGTHLDSRTFIRDLYDILGPDFDIHRVLRDGLQPLGPWNERLEIFRLGNYAALRRPAT